MMFLFFCCVLANGRQQGAVTQSCAREQQGHRCDPQNAPCGTDVLGAQARASTLVLFDLADGSLLRMARQDARR